ncbi:MAG: hypothetical protein IIU00_07075 [Clostridia bacterium]|nr:hypothetical protein [Clostridia bacterium]
MKEKKVKGRKARVVRAIAGVLLIVQCVVLIAFFGLMPLAKYSPLPILKDKSDIGSIYGKGSLAFVRETQPDKLKAGQIAVYYSGDTPVGAKITANNSASRSLLVSNGSDAQSVAYSKITGQGTGFSVPLLGSYANWLIHGIGLLVTVITMGVLFLLFAIAGIFVRYDN